MFHAATLTLNTATVNLVGNMPATTQGDYLCAAITQDVGGKTITPPGGWVLVDTLAAFGTDSQSVMFFEFTGGAPSSPPGSYTWTSNGNDNAQVLIMSFSGRSLSRTFLTATAAAGAFSTPVSASFTGGTAAANDDLIVIMALDKNGGSDARSFSTPTGSPGTFTLQTNNDTQSFTGIGMATLDGVAAGATGTISDTITRTSGSSTTGYGGWVIGLAAARPSASGIVFQSATAAIYSAISGTTVVPNYPSSVAAGDLLVMFVGQKPGTANAGTVTTPSGWTLEASLTGSNDGNTGGYTTTTGADVGNCNIYVYTKVASGSETGSLSVAVTVGTNGVTWALMMRWSNGTKLWSTGSATGKQVTTPTSPLSIAFGTDPGVRKNDVVMVGFCIPTDVTTPAQFSSETLTQTGVTFGTVTEVEEPDSTVGNDIGGVVVRAPVTAGPSSGAPTFGSTIGGTLTNVRGPAAFLRIRERLVGLPPLQQQRQRRNPQFCM